MQEIVDAFYIAGRTEDRQRLEDALWSCEAVYATTSGTLRQGVDGLSCAGQPLLR